MNDDIPDRAMIVAAVMPDVLALRLDSDDDEVGFARIRCDGEGICAGLAVAKEILGRVGARLRPLVQEGATVRPGDAVADLGGPLAAIRGAAPLALTWLHRLSAVASGATPPTPGDPLESAAARLSGPHPVGHDGPSFHVEFEG